MKKKVLNEKPKMGQIYVYAMGESVCIHELDRTCSNIYLTLTEAKSLLELLPSVIAEVEENIKKNREEEDYE